MKNKWILGRNQHSNIISDYLSFSKLSTLDQLVSLNDTDLEALLIKYGNSLTHRYKENTVESKLQVITMFYSYHGIKINILELLQEVTDNTSHLKGVTSTT